MQTLILILAEFWNTLCEMAPYLLFGFLVAGMLSVLVSPALVAKHLGGRGIWPIFKASLFGVPLPLCSCSVIPVAASLRRHGASKGATTAFLLSTPQTGADSIMVTFSLLGPVFAVFRPLAAFLTGLVGGSIVETFGSSAAQIEPCRDACCCPTRPQSRLMRVLHYGFVVLPGEIGRPLLLGLVVAGAIAAFIPANFFSETIGTGFLAMVVMMVLGIPVYVCATASVPVAAAMMLKGISPGAALVFLMTGPATNAAAIATLWKVLGKRSALIYLGVVVISALGSGLLMDYVFTIGNVLPGPATVWMLPLSVKIISALVLLAVLGVAVFRPRRQHPEAHAQT